MPRFAFGEVVRVRGAEETSARGIAGCTGMIVGAKVPAGSGEILGGGELEDAVLVSLDEPVAEVILVAGRLLQATGEQAEWEIVDGRIES